MIFKLDILNPFTALIEDVQEINLEIGEDFSWEMLLTNVPFNEVESINILSGDASTFVSFD